MPCNSQVSAREKVFISRPQARAVVGGIISISIAVLMVALVLIATRQAGRIRLQIWQIMLMGASAVLLTGQISPHDALKAINPDVMIFLACMFTVGEAMYQSGYLFHLSHQLFRMARSTDQLLILILFSMGMLSAVLMNDTLAIVGTPLMLHFARAHQIPPKMLLLALAFAVTTGSVMSPIGNPQNLLIALGGELESPFISFIEWLFIPTMINLAAAYILLKVLYRGQIRPGELHHTQEQIKDSRMASAAKASFIILLVLIAAKIAAVQMDIGAEIKLTYIAVAAAAPVVIFSSRRAEIMRGIDWRTLIFFASMFVLMESVWRSGIFQSALYESGTDIATTPMILAVSIILSQLISNVPFVALYLPLLGGTSVKGMMALAAGSTIAGNMLILGAASNVIIIQNAEKRGETISFMEFARVGLPLTAINAIIYWLFLR